VQPEVDHVWLLQDRTNTSVQYGFLPNDVDITWRSSQRAGALRQSDPCPLNLICSHFSSTHERSLP
jgi:hypothetical protein